MTQSNFVLPNQIHDIGSLVAECKQWRSDPSVDDLWAAYLARIPMETTDDEIQAIQSWFFQEVEKNGYEFYL